MIWQNDEVVRAFTTDTPLGFGRFRRISADHADPRSYSAEQAETRLQAFMESFS